MLQSWVNEFICWCLGHTCVSIEALPQLRRLTLTAFDKDIESVCLRCSQRWRSLASNVFAPSPLQDALNKVPKWGGQAAADTAERVNQWP